MNVVVLEICTLANKNQEVKGDKEDFKVQRQLHRGQYWGKQGLQIRGLTTGSEAGQAQIKPLPQQQVNVGWAGTRTLYNWL